VTWSGPFAGIRLTDFCWWGVGALATRTLADMGAEVIKIEDRGRPDLTRTLPPYPDELVSLGEVGAVTNFDRSGFFNNHNRNKRSMLLNMRHPRGREICRALIAKSDIVSENFRPGVMERWGLTYEAMTEIKPDIIFARLSGLGHTGPEAGYGTVGPVVQALSGLTALGGLPGEVPSGWGYSYMDNTAAYYGTIAMLLALYHRNATGEGQEVNVAAVEAGINMLGPDLLDYTANGRKYRRDGMPPGNRLTSRPAAPHGVYPTSEQDRWIAISVFSDEEWAALLDVMGQPAWAENPCFATLEARVKYQDELDGHMAAWTAGQERYSLMERLQAAGVCAGVVQTGQDRAEYDPQARLYDLYPIVDHPTMGPSHVEGLPFKLSGSPAREEWRSGPLLGADTEYVLTEVLGMDGAAVKELEADGVI
jgi:crotonobetainyl-CoA:carnitine CoA-transferase CaiB-like acyl-CoA transferase